MKTQLLALFLSCVLCSAAYAQEEKLEDRVQNHVLDVQVFAANLANNPPGKRKAIFDSGYFSLNQEANNLFDKTRHSEDRVQNLVEQSLEALEKLKIRYAEDIQP